MRVIAGGGPAEAAVPDLDDELAHLAGHQWRRRDLVVLVLLVLVSLVLAVLAVLLVVGVLPLLIVAVLPRLWRIGRGAARIGLAVLTAVRAIVLLLPMVAGLGVPILVLLGLLVLLGGLVVVVVVVVVLGQDDAASAEAPPAVVGVTVRCQVGVDRAWLQAEPDVAVVVEAPLDEQLARVDPGLAGEALARLRRLGRKAPSGDSSASTMRRPKWTKSLPVPAGTAQAQSSGLACGAGRGSGSHTASASPNFGARAVLIMMLPLMIWPSA